MDRKTETQMARGCWEQFEAAESEEMMKSSNGSRGMGGYSEGGRGSQKAVELRSSSNSSSIHTI